MTNFKRLRFASVRRKQTLLFTFFVYCFEQNIQDFFGNDFHIDFVLFEFVRGMNDQ